MAIHFTDEDFEKEVFKSDLPVLVDFFAEWCGPCKMMGPIIEKLADEYAGKIKIGKMDVDANEKIPAQFMIQSIPTLVFFKDGKAVKQVTGYRSEEDLRAQLEILLKS